jgi:isoleucyl-tRNA synthetase
VDTRSWARPPAEDQIRWQRLLAVRDEVLKALEAARQEKRIGTSLEARVNLAASADDYPLLRDYGPQLPALFIVSQVDLQAGRDGATAVSVERAHGKKCERCWNYSIHVGESAEMPGLCERCRAALEQMGGR